MVVKYQRFNFIFFLVSLVPLVGVATINYTIDPYGVFAFPKIDRVNNLKPKQKNTGRIYKSFDIRRIKPQIVLLGSSRVEDGLNSQHPALIKRGNTYNLGFQAGNTYEILRYLEHTINQQPELEQVILGIDFFMFNKFLPNQNTFDERRLSKAYPIKDSLNFLLSIDALNSSKNTLITSLKAQNQPIERSQKQFQFWLQEFLQNQQLYGNYTLSQDRLNTLQSIVDLCRQHNIELKIFISPTHATQYEAIASAELWTTFEQWKKEIVKITPVWDFATYNSVTTETIGDRMENYIDNSHYSEETGNLVLNRILAYDLEKVPEDFGILITEKNIVSHLDNNRRARKQWRNNAAEEVRLVKQIKNNIESK